MLFIGAGFSASAGIPTMNTFLESLRDSKFLSIGEQWEFDAIYRECAALSGLIGASARNLESIASFLSVLAVTRPKFEFPNCKHFRTPAQALSLLTDAIRHIARPGLTSRDVGQTRGFMGNLIQHNNFSVTIITTNYDINVELACAPVGDAYGSQLHCRLVEPLYTNMIATDANANYRAPSLYASSTDLTKPLLLKLHGSVNWYRKDRTEVRVDAKLKAAENEHGEPIVDATGSAASLQLEQPGIKGDTAISNPLIVPPTVLKMREMEAFEAQWRAAASALAQADQVWFIGYSFPESDSYMKYFIASGLSQNARIRHIAIVDPSYEVCYGRALPLFNSGLFREVVNAFPFQWQQVQLQCLLNRNPLGMYATDRDIHEAERRIRAQNLLDGVQNANWNSDESDLPSPGRSLRGRGRGRGRW